jgi:hypothetical protein
MKGFYVLICSLVLIQQSHAQFKNILVDAGSANNKPHSPSIAVNPGDPKNIVAISAPNNVYYSFNGGLAWQKSQITSALAGVGQPLLVSDFKGNFFFFNLPDKKSAKDDKTFHYVVVQESSDGGKTWTDGSSIAGTDSTKYRYDLRAIVDRKGNWYATWTQFDAYGTSDSTCQSRVLMSTSSNGKKWSKPVQVSQTPGDCLNQGNSTIGATPTVTSDGSKVFIAWANQQKIFVDRSFDGGKMWLSTDLGIVEQAGGAIMNVPGLNACNGKPVLVCDNTKSGEYSGALYIVWADQVNGENDTDVWFTRSLNYGDNWTQPLRVNNDEAGKQQFLPSMAVDPTNGHLYIVYYDRRNYDDSQTDVYIAYSTNAGASFSNVKISETPFVPTSDVIFGDHISISANKGIITPIWTRMDNGQTSIWTAVIKHGDLEKAK